MVHELPSQRCFARELSAVRSFDKVNEQAGHHRDQRQATQNRKPDTFFLSRVLRPLLLIVRCLRCKRLLYQLKLLRTTNDES